MPMTQRCFVMSLVMGAVLFAQEASPPGTQPHPEARSGAAEVAPPSAPVQRVASDLKRHPFDVAGLTLTVLDFSKKTHIVWAFSTYLTPGVGGITLQVENKSSTFMVFSPAKLIILGRDGNQATLAKEQFLGEHKPPSETQIAPGGRFTTKYNLSAGVHLPARMFYDQHLLAEVIE